MNEKTLLAAVDIGGSNVRCALSRADRPLDFLTRRSAPTPAASVPSAFVDFLFEQIDACLAEANCDRDALASLGCTAPGITDARRGVVVSAANLSGWVNVPLAELLRAKFGVPVAVENDVNAAALGEREFGAGRGADSLIYLTISTGVAAGIITDGKLLRGFRQCAGEIGFILSEPAQIGRDWGHNGALELTAAGIGIARQWQTQNANRENVTAVDVFRAAREGDAAAMEIVT
ncbi:MAG TPA: ROK family protein, partial [Pyrinomonadaceae bacterium]|nr:ROK family protein [Pyrinomonadaceae bacterium]